MFPIANFEQHGRKLLEPDQTMDQRLQLASTVRDSIEVTHSSEYANFLKGYFRVFSTLLLQMTKPQTTDTVEHKLRNVLLEILNKLPHNDVLKPHVNDLLKLSMYVLSNDNEENATICLRIIFDLHKNYRPNLDAHVQPFLDFVKTIYSEFKATVNYFFSESEPNSALTQTSTSPKLNPSTRSFKVVSECPLIVMFLFQIYQRHVAGNVPALLPLMMSAISTPGPMNPPPNLKQVFADLKISQIKTVSFLTYLLRSHADYIRPDEENIAKGIVHLLSTCPDLVLYRKELLVATRHVIATDFKRAFFPHMDRLLDESVLVGSDRACYETLRPLAYTLLSELVHHIRLELSLFQISKVIYLFSRNIHDLFLPFSVQTTCIRLMLNLVETIYSRRIDQANRDEGRALLGYILDSFVNKFSTMKKYVKMLIENEDNENKQKIFSFRSQLELPVQTALNIQTSNEYAKDVSDCKQLLKTLIMGMKTLIWSITNYNNNKNNNNNNNMNSINSAQSSHFTTKSLKDEEVILTSKILKSSLICLSLFKNEEEKDMCFHFSSIFVVMEYQSLMDIFSLSMPYLLHIFLKNEQLRQIFSQLLQNEKTNRYFGEVLVTFLIDSKLKSLKFENSPDAELLLQVFPLILKMITQYPSECEPVLQPHLTKIMETCIAGMEEQENPNPYLRFLQILFRSLSVGKYDLLFREISPSLQACLKAFLDLLITTAEPEMHNLLVELCLTYPAHLSSLLPHLSSLMKPLLFALEAKNELLDLGLKTLELWVDNLNPEFLEPIMAPVMDRLLFLLWSKLKPKPYTYGTKVAQILGKMGGRNRRVLNKPMDLECKENMEHGLRLVLTFHPSISFLIPLDRFIHMTCSVVTKPEAQEEMDVYCRQNALKFLYTVLSSILNLKINIPNEKETIYDNIAHILLSFDNQTLQNPENASSHSDLGVKTKTQLLAEKNILKEILTAIICSHSYPHFHENDNDFLNDLCRHFAIILHLDSNTKKQKTENLKTANTSDDQSTSSIPMHPSKQSNLKYLHPKIFLDALTSVLTCQNQTHAQSAIHALKTFVDTLLLLAKVKSNGSDSSKISTVDSNSVNSVNPFVQNLNSAVWDDLIGQILHACYGATWHEQMGGISGLNVLISKIPVEILCSFQVKAVRAILHVLKRLPENCLLEIKETSQTLTQFLKVVNTLNVGEEENEERNKIFQQVVDVLAGELFNPNATSALRRSIQSCLSLLAARSGSEVSELLEKNNQPLVQSLLSRQLRTRHIEHQIGTLMALNYCLSLRPPLMHISSELTSILQEALAVAEADEAMLQGKYMTPKQTALVTRLRTVSIEILCTAMAWADFKQSPSHAEFRTRVIAMFFKCLTCQTPEIIAVAKEGLRQVINQQKMPKDLLSNSLRPILINLAHYKNLNLPLLQGLSRLLELLSNWFNVTLGDKLKDHLRKWLEPEKLSLQPKAWKPGEEAIIAASIIDLFHLLPQAASKFLDDLVVLTIQLEANLPLNSIDSPLNSPYIQPLTRFLNRYSPAAVDYFLARLNQPPYFNRFIHIIKSDLGQVLRDELAKSSDKIIIAAFHNSRTLQNTVNENSQSFATLNADDTILPGIILIRTLTKLIPDFLSTNQQVFFSLLNHFQSPLRIQRFNNEADNPLPVIKENKLLVKCFLNYLRHKHSDVNVLFELLTIFLCRSRIDFSFLREYFMIEVPSTFSAEEKKQVLIYFLDNFSEHLKQQERNVLSIQLIIIPLLTYSFEHDEINIVVDSAIVKNIVENLLDPKDEISAEWDEPLIIELLQLATLLIRFVPEELKHFRRELIKFGWNHLKRETSSKQWAFVNVCYFLDAYQAPEKIILQVFVALLRACQPENKVLVKQALDVLMPALPKRLPLGDSKLPIWIRYAKKIMIEEGHSLPHLIHIFQLLVKHPHVFYSSRSQFIPQIIGSLQRLGLAPNCLIENRRLSADLAGLVILWDKRRIVESQSLKSNAGSVKDETGSDSKPEGEESQAGSNPVLVGEKRGLDDSGMNSAMVEMNKRMKVEVADGVQAIQTVPGLVPKPTFTAGSVNQPTDTSLSNLNSGVNTIANASVEDEFKPTFAMEDMIITFLVRLAFITEPKDRDSTCVYNQTLQLLEDALSLWPSANIKLNYVERYLNFNAQSNQSKPVPGNAPPNPTNSNSNLNSKEIIHSLKTIIKMIDISFKTKSNIFIIESPEHIINLLEMSFSRRAFDIIQSLTQVFFSSIYQFHASTNLDPSSSATSASTTPDLLAIESNIQSFLKRHLDDASKPSVDANSANLNVSYSLFVLNNLPSQLREKMIENLFPSLFQILQALTQEWTLSNQISTSIDSNTEVGSLNYNIEMIIKIIYPKVLNSSLNSNDYKKRFFSIFELLLNEKNLSSNFFDLIIDVVCDWVQNCFSDSNPNLNSNSNPNSNSNSNSDVKLLSLDDIILILKWICKSDRSHLTKDQFINFENKFLKLIYKFCSDSSSYNPSIRQEIFQKIERNYVLGLRAHEPTLRHNFFLLYNDVIPPSLFHRLQFIFTGTEWDVLSQHFWIREALDFIFSMLNKREWITLAPNAGQTPFLSFSDPVISAAHSQSLDGMDEDLKSNFLSVVKEETRFIHRMNEFRVSDLISSLREFSTGDAYVSYHLWILIFPIVWETLKKEEQIQLAKPIITMLSKECLLKQVNQRPNVVQALMEGLSLSQPQPRLPSELIKFLGKTYNAWHLAIPLLESHVSLFPLETRCFGSLAELYRLLNEDDMLYGLWMKRNEIKNNTRSAMAFLQHSYWKQAQYVFFSSMNNSIQGLYGADIAKGELALWEDKWIKCSKELNQWEMLSEFARDIENYDIQLEASWKLHDWAYLKDVVIPNAEVELNPRNCIIKAYTSLNDMSSLSLEEANARAEEGMDITLQRWWEMPEKSILSFIPLMHNFQQFVEINESSRILLDIANANKLINPLTTSLSQSQSITAVHSNCADLKDILEAWRLRVANDWDDLSMWGDIALWRNNMFNTIISSFKHLIESDHQLHQLGFREKAWCVNRFGNVARKQNQGELSVRILNQMYGYMTMDVVEAFVKIKQQAKAYMDMKGELSTGLNLVNVSNLDFFSSPQKAEIFRLKALFLQSLGNGESANQSFSASITVCKSFAKGWYSWANYCNEVFKETGEQIWLEYTVSCFLQSIKYGSKQGSNILARILYLLSFDNGEGTVGRIFDSYIDSIPHWIWLFWIPQLLMSLQRPEYSHTKAVLLRIAQVYPQALFYWLRTYLLERRDIAQRTEMALRAANANLAQISRTQIPNLDPQKLASTNLVPEPERSAPNPRLGNPLETSHTPPIQGQPNAMETNQSNQVNQGGQTDQNSQLPVNAVNSSVQGMNMHGGNDNNGNKAGVVSGGNGNASNANVDQGSSGLTSSRAESAHHTLLRRNMASLEVCKDIMEVLRMKYANLTAELELMVAELAGRFSPLPEERLLAVVNALLHRCYKFPTYTSSDVPMSLRKELAGVCKACFSSDSVSKHVDFVNEYKCDFERDLDPESASFPKTLSSLTERLKHWEGILQSNVEERLPAVLKLEDQSQHLRDWNVVDIEMPGEYLTDNEIIPENAVKLVKIGSDVPIIRRHGSSHRKLSFYGNDGSKKTFIVQTTLTPSARSDERMIQLFRAMNRLLDKHRETRRRSIRFHIPIIIPVLPQIRLVEESSSYCSLSEVYEINCARYGRESDLPIIHFKERLNEAFIKRLSGESLQEMRLMIYREIASKLVNETILSQFLYKCIPHPCSLWTFKKQLCTQLALSNCASFLLQIGGRSPNKILFAKNSGKIFQVDFHPAYDSEGVLECQESVPFRLTRNLQTFFSAFATNGLYVSAMAASVQAILAPKSESLRHHLAMFFRDELISYLCRRPPGTAALASSTSSFPSGNNPSLSSSAPGNISIQDLKRMVTVNVDNVLQRATGIDPQTYVNEQEEEENGGEERDEAMNIHRGVLNLMDAASNPSNLCMMDPTWHPWF